MKKIIMTLAAVLCCAMTIVFNACQGPESQEEMQVKLVGTWTEKNDLYNDVLTLNEDGSFTFSSTTTLPNYQSHANLYNGSGSYKYEIYLASDITQNPNDAIRGILHLIYGGKQTQSLRVRKFTDSTLELTNYNGDILRFSR